jgi:hypothetical protein
LSQSSYAVSGLCVEGHRQPRINRLRHLCGEPRQTRALLGLLLQRLREVLERRQHRMEHLMDFLFELMELNRCICVAARVRRAHHLQAIRRVSECWEDVAVRHTRAVQ